jgi:uncharacterized membrane protein YfcA
LPGASVCLDLKRNFKMSASVFILLLGCGLLGGIANAIAGGATLITFPAMLAAGLPPTVANASSAVAVTAGTLVAAVVDRSRLKADLSAFATVLVTSIGGGLGGMIMLHTSEHLFTMLVPVLIGGATLLFAFSNRLRRRTHYWSHLPEGEGTAAIMQLVLLFPIALYGGYFAAGLGILLMAAFSLSGVEDLRTANTLKNLVATVVSLTSVAVFASQGAVRWPETLIMLVGALCGGAIGGKLITILSPSAIKAAIVVIGCAMGIAYTGKYWF